MARIRNYVTDNNITDQDIVVGSDGDNSGVTKNFNVSTLKQYISNGLVEEAPIDGVTYSRKDAEWVASSLSSDEIIEVNTYSELPFPGASGVLYLILDTSKLFVWNGSYSEVNQSSISPFSNITEGGNVGIVRTARNPLNYGDVGSGAIDFSISTDVSSTYGATGLNSFASGRSNKSPGSFSHSQNIQNKANGYASSASGIYNVASGRGEMATGMYGTEYTATDTITDKVFNVGAGTSTLNKKDVFSLFRNLAAKFTPTALSSITNQVAGFFIFDSSDSNRPAVHNGIAWKKLAYQDDVPSITIDSIPTDGSSNAVSSNGTFDALALKADLVSGKVPSSQLPSYVDDVIEVANFAALPLIGETGKLYITIDTSFVYRWTGSVYVQIATGGSVTSVGLTMPSAFSVSNSPITSSGSIAVTGAGTTLQYIRGDGTLATLPTSTSTVAHGVKYGEAITIGQAVYVTSADGTNMIVSKASNTSEATSSKTMGLVTASGALNYQGIVVTEGLVAGLNTDSGNAGDPVWLGTNGNLIFGLVNKPVAPNHLVFIGIITRKNVNNGEIFVKVQNGFELQELHNVLITGLTDKNLLTYNSSTQLWENKTIGSVIGGLSSQYLRGDGTVAAFPTTTGGGSSVTYYLNGGTSQGTFGGSTYYEISKSSVIGSSANFSLTNTTGYIAQFITDVADPSLLSIPQGAWNFLFYFNASTINSAGSFYVELYKYNGTTFTLIADSSASPEVITNGLAIDLYTTSVSVPLTTLTTSDRLAVRVFVNTNGNKTITLHTQDGTLCEIVTTLSTGLNALNNLTNQVQYFATGTTGTDLNISSATDTHTFNLPTASAANRGALSSSDWTTFNNKISTSRTISTTSPLSGGGDLSTDRTLSIDNAVADGSTKGAAAFIASDFNSLSGVISIDYTNGQSANASNKGFLTSGDWTTFNSKQDALSSGVNIKTINGNSVLGSGDLLLGVPLTRQEFSFSGAQTFTLSGTPSDIYAVFVNGQELNSSQYFFVTTTLTISDTLQTGDKINILYTPTSVGVLEYYTKAQIDGFLTNSNIESIIGQASGVNSGYLSFTDWLDFDAKQDAITLTTNNFSGVATLIGNTLNIPNYDGFIPKLRGHETFRGVNYSNNSTTEVTSGGITIATTGSTIARAVASTNYASKQVRKGFYGSTVSAGRYTGTRGSALLWFLGGGFKYVCDVYISDTAFGSGCRQFYGMAGQTTDLAYSDSVLVSSLTNIIGVGSDALDTNLQVFYNDATGTATKVDLGVNFPANRTAGSALTTVYSIELYNDSASTDVKYCVRNKETGSIAMGTLSSDLPLHTQGLNFFASRCMGAGVTNTGQFDLLTLGVYSL